MKQGQCGGFLLGMVLLWLLPAGCGPAHPIAAVLSKPEANGVAPVTGQTATPGLFRDVAAAAGLRYGWGHTNLSGLNILETIGHGCAFLDYDGVTALYHNEGQGRFRDATPGSGLEARAPNDWTTSASWADVDGDGKLDLYICRYVAFGPETKQLCSYVTLNGTKLDMACSPGVYAPQVGSLYHNEGNGHFRDITRSAGLTTAHGNALGCMFCDFNGDGRPDLYVANDEKPGDLFLNMGYGRFRNIGMESGTAYSADGTPLAGMGLDWGDYDGDGRFDLLVANFAAQPKSLFHNEGDGLFVDRSYASGLGAKTLLPLAFGAQFIDVDNDGLLDVVLTNGHVFSEIEKTSGGVTYRQATQIFRNLGGGRFADASSEAGSDFNRPIVGRGIAVGDYDGDGRPDLLIVDDEGAPLLLHNEAKNANHWLTLRCLTSGGRTDAIGARVTVTAAGRKHIAEVRASGSYLSTSAPELHFGLEAATKADLIEVRWPGGGTSSFRNVAADHAYRLTPDQKTPAVWR